MKIQDLFSIGKENNRLNIEEKETIMYNQSDLKQFYFVEKH